MQWSVLLCMEAPNYLSFALVVKKCLQHMNNQRGLVSIYTLFQKAIRKSSPTEKLAKDMERQLTEENKDKNIFNISII